MAPRLVRAGWARPGGAPRSLWGGPQRHGPKVGPVTVACTSASVRGPVWESWEICRDCISGGRHNGELSRFLYVLMRKDCVKRKKTAWFSRSAGFSPTAPGRQARPYTLETGRECCRKCTVSEISLSRITGIPDLLKLEYWSKAYSSSLEYGVQTPRTPRYGPRAPCSEVCMQKYRWG